MGNLNMSVDEIKQYISLREEYWEYDFDTNCYAFSLGLDLPENDIIENAYQLGVMGAVIFDIPTSELRKMSYEERLFLDMKALNISCEECLPTESSWYKIHSKNKKSSIERYWLISLFQNDNDFHFLRKNYDGIWYHKRGNFAPPINYDSNKKIIINPEECIIGTYKYVKTYKLRYKEKYHSLFL